MPETPSGSHPVTMDELNQVLDSKLEKAFEKFVIVVNIAFQRQYDYMNEKFEAIDRKFE